MKIAIMTDSNSGIQQSEADKLGVFVLPMPFVINGDTYYEGINLNYDQFFEFLRSNADVSTSQPSIASLTETWDKLLQEYDKVIFIPMSSGLSGTCDTAKTFARNYDGRVLVVDNKRISVTLKQSVLDALELVKKGYTAEQIKDELEKNGPNSSIYIMVDTLKYLKKGGRITAAGAAIGTLLKIKPVLTIQGEKLDAYQKVMSVKQAKIVMINAIKKDIQNRFGGDSDDLLIAMAYTYDLEAAKLFMNEVQQSFPNKNIVLDPLSLSVSCHIGPGALAVTVTKKGY